MKKLLIPFIFLISSTSYGSVQTSIEMQDQYGVAGSDVILSARHHVNILNTAATNKTYNLTFELCADQKRCISQTITKVVAPGQPCTQFYISTMKPSYHFRGNYGMHAKTIVTGAENALTEKHTIAHIN